MGPLTIFTKGERNKQSGLHFLIPVNGVKKSKS